MIFYSQPSYLILLKNSTVILVEETLQCVILPLSSLLWWFHMCFLVMEMMSSLNLLVPGCVFKSAKKWVNVVKKCSSLYTWCVSLDIKNGQTQCHSTGLRYWFCSMSQFHFTYMHNIAKKTCIFFMEKLFLPFLMSGFL